MLSEDDSKEIPQKYFIEEFEGGKKLMFILQIQSNKMNKSTMCFYWHMLKIWLCKGLF